MTGASQVALGVKNPPANAGDIGDVDSIPGLGRLPGGGHGNPFQCSCLGNPMDRGTWRATVHSNLLPPEGFEGGGISQRTNSLLLIQPRA